MQQRVLAGIAVAMFASSTSTAYAENGLFDWFRGDWSLTLGAAGYISPGYVGDDSVELKGSPIISFGRTGTEKRFSSRNDNISIAFIDTGSFRAGPTGKLVFERDEDTDEDLDGLDPVRFGGEIGGFAEIYPLDWLRLRGEVRHGIRSHDGVVAELYADAFYDVTPAIRVSGGPRASFASADYFDAYYGVDAEEAAESGLSEYEPGGGANFIGLGGAVTWKTTDKVTTSLFGEYSRLMDSAADSSLVDERGSPNQFTIGISASYRFDFTL